MVRVVTFAALGAVLLVVLVVLGACSLGQSSSPSASARMTALAAARFALERDSTIRAKLPNGRVGSISANNPSVPAMDGTAPEWVLGVADPVSFVVYQYALKDRRVGVVASGTVPLKDNLPLVADLVNGNNLADVMDSDRAIQVTEALGGAEYRKQTGAEILSMFLGGFAGQQLEWNVFYSKPLTDHQATLRIDARTGDLIKVDGDDFSKEDELGSETFGGGNR